MMFKILMPSPGDKAGGCLSEAGKRQSANGISKVLLAANFAVGECFFPSWLGGGEKYGVFIMQRANDSCAVQELWKEANNGCSKTRHD